MAITDEVQHMITRASKESSTHEVREFFAMLYRFNELDRKNYLKKMARKVGKSWVELADDYEAYLRLSRIDRLRDELGDAFEDFMDLLDRQPEVTSESDTRFRAGFLYGWLTSRNRDTMFL